MSCKPSVRLIHLYVLKNSRETLSEEILGKMHASGTSKSKYPVITPNDFKAVDGVIIGTPTRYVPSTTCKQHSDIRYGRVPAQVSTFFDQCGSLWASGAMVGKFVCPRNER
jgi:NAD(P)H dehydrogenase (quinone)